MFEVEYGVKGAYRILNKKYDSYDEADRKAKRWAATNSIGSYWAVVKEDGRTIQSYNLGRR